MDSRGPQFAQAVGWAWKRRLLGSSYSRLQGGHNSNADIVVFTLSYGSPVVIV